MSSSTPRGTALPSRAAPAVPDDRPVEVVPPVAVDVVGTLLEALQGPEAADLPSGSPRHRPVDVQYWACWAATPLVLAILAILWVTS